MIDPNHQPPAIVRGAASVNERVHKARDLQRKIAEADKLSLGMAIEQGKELLAIHQEVPHGQWLPTLEKIGVGERAAQRRMKVAAYVAANPSDRRIWSCESFEVALEYVAQQQPPAPSSGVSTYGATNDPLKCERHNRTGGGSSQCKKCAALMRKAAKKEAALAEARGDPAPERQPGDDTEAEAAAAAAEKAAGKNGQPIPGLKDINALFGKLAHAADLLAHRAGHEKPARREADAPRLVLCPEHAELLRVLEEAQKRFERFVKSMGRTEP